MTKRTHLGLPYDMTFGEFWKDEYNEMVRRVSALIHSYAISNQESDPPSGAADGDTYIVAAGATHDWAGKESYIAVYNGFSSEWEFYAPEFGLRMWVQTTGTSPSLAGMYIYKDSTGWEPDTLLQWMLDHHSIAVITFSGSDGETYTMSESESQAMLKVILNSGLNCKLKWAQGIYGPLQVISQTLNSETLTLEDASATNSLQVTGRTSHIIFYDDANVLQNLSADAALVAQQQLQLVIEVDTASNDLSNNTIGELTVYTRATAQTLTIKDNDVSGYPKNAQKEFFVKGAGGLTIQSDSDVIINGPTSFAQNEGGKLVRNNETNEWYIIKWA